MGRRAARGHVGPGVASDVVYEVRQSWKAVPAAVGGGQLCLGCATRRVAVRAGGKGERINALQINLLVREVVGAEEVVGCMVVSVEAGGVCVRLRTE
jgi:hypothetical protein